MVMPDLGYLVPVVQHTQAQLLLVDCAGIIEVCRKIS
jgi:hypothetical protein